MTAQEVIQKFMNKLANHGYSANTVTGEKMLDAAVRASSRFAGIQNVIDSMKADQKTCEQEAIREVVTAVCGETFFNDNCLNEDGSVKSLSDIETVLNAATKADGSAITKDDVKNFIGYQYHNLSDVIREVTANNFLENYCGIELNNTFGFSSNGTLYRITNKPKGTDTGAITGSDAGGPIDKTEKSVVPEAFINTYIASTEAAQSISTGTRDWVVQMTAANDTIVSGGADSINAGAGNDLIEVNGSGATVTSGEGTDKIKISAQVKDVTITDFNAEDVMTISGTFEIGSAKIEDMILVITDTTGTRKLKFAEFTDAQDGKLKINGASTTIGKWLAASGIDINTLSQTTYATSVGVTNSKSLAENSQEVSVDSDERTLIYPDWKPSAVEEPTVPDRRAPVDDRGELYESSNIPSDATITVDLATVNTDTAGNVEFGGQVVGTTSSTFPKATTFTRNGLTIHLLGGTDSTSSSTSKIKSKTFDQLTDDQKTIIAALFKWWEAETLKLNEESYGIGFNSDTVMVKDIGLYFYNNPISGVLATVFNWQRTADGFTTQLMLSVNMGYYSGIDNSDCDGVSSASGAGFLDRTLAHEMTHAIMAGNINFFNKLPKFIKEGFAELTHGIDDGRGNSIFKIAYDATQLDGSITLSDTGTGSQDVGDAYSGGYMFLRYFAKQAALQTSTMPAFGDITVNVDLNALGNLEEGNILYIDTAQVNPTVMVAKDEKTFLNDIEDPTDTLINLGTVCKDSQGDFYYRVDNNLFTQNITTSTQIPEVYGANSKTIINGNDDYDGVIIVEGATSVNTGAGDDFINIKGQYATINAGSGDDSVIVSDGGHNLINLGEGNNSVRVYGGLLINNKTNYYSQHYGNTITGGAGNDTITNGDGLIIVDEDGNFYSYDDIAESVQKDENGNFYITFTDGKTSKVTPYIFDQHNHDYKIDLGNGNNVIELSLIYDNTIRTGKGDDIISTGVGTGNSIVTGAGNDSIYSGVYESKIFTGSGNDTLNFKYSNLNKNLIDLGENDDMLNVGGSYNTVIAGEGNDTIKIYENSAGKNIFVFGEDFGNDSMRGFMSNDTIKLIEGFTATVGESVEGAYTSNGSVIGTYQKFTLTVKNGDKIEGTIDIITASNQTFDAEKNIIYERKDSFMTEISTWDGTVAESFKTIDEDAKTITIVKANELALLAQNVNKGNTYNGWTIKLGIDLDLSVEDFTSIGNLETKSFEGTFDGGIYDEERNLISKHTITGMKVNGSLFGFVGNGGTIKNVDLKNATLYGKNNCCGVLVGSLNNGTVENCAAYNCTVSTVTGIEHVGSLIGSVAQNSTVTKCAAYNCVVYGYKYVGGLIGSAYGNVSDCTVINTTVNHTDTTYFGAMFGDSGSGISNNYYYNGSDQMKGNWQNSENTEYGTTELFTVTLPEGVSATGDGVKGIVDDEAYCVPNSTITLLSTTGTLKSIVNNGETLNSVRGELTYQVQTDTVFSNPQNFSSDDIVQHEPKDGDTLEFTNDASDYVTVKSGVSNFTINGGFRAEDKIVFEETVTAVETIDGGFKAVYEDGSEVSISGVNLASDEGEWKQQNEVASYTSSINAGASLNNNNQIVYVGNKILTFELDGITDTKDFAVGRGLASLNTSGFGNTVSVKSNAGKYGFTIDGDGTDKTFNGMNDAENADIIFNYSDGIKINMFNGNDFVYSYRSNVTIDAGAGNDTIGSYSVEGGVSDSKNVSLNAGEGNNVVQNNGANATILAGSGNDSVYNYGEKAVIDAGDGNNTVLNQSTGSNVSITTGADNDLIENYGASAVIDAGGGHDYILSSGNNATIDLGAGNNTIRVEGAFNYDEFDGDPYFYANNFGNSIKGGSGDDVLTNGEGVLFAVNGVGILNADELGKYFGGTVVKQGGVWYLAQGGKLVADLTNYVSVYDFYQYNSNFNVDLGDGNNEVNLSNVQNSTIKTGSGVDMVVVGGGQKVLIDAGEGINIISNAASEANIVSGTGNDTIYNRGVNTSIDAGNGNNFITIQENLIYNNGAYYNYNSGNSIKGGTGDDKVVNENLTNKNFIIVDVYGNTYTYEEISPYLQFDTEEQAYFYMNGDKKVYVTTAAQLNQNFNIDLGDGNNNVNLSNLYNSSIKTGSGNDWISVSGGDSISIDAGDGTNIISNWYAGNVSIVAGKDGDLIENSGANAVIDAGAGNDSIDNFGEDASINGGLGNDIILIAANNSSVNVSEGDDLIQVEADSVSLFKVEGFGAGDSIQFVQYNEGTNSYEPIAATSLSKDGDKLVAVAGNSSVMVEGVSSLSEESIGWSFDEESSKAIYGAQTVAGAKLDADGNIVYNKDSVDVMLEIDNVSSTPTLEGTTVKLSPSIMSVSDEVYVTKNVNGYTFEIGAGSYSGTKFYGTKTADTITNNGTNIFIDGMEGNDLITNNGASGVSISTAKGNDTIKVGADVQSFSVQSFAAGDVIELNSETTTLEAVTGGIKAGDVSIFGITDLASVNNSWQASETDITYKQTTVTGAQVSGKTITYKTKSTSEDLFKIDGLNSSVGVNVAGDEVTLYQTALENSTGAVSISGGNYKFKLAEDVDQVKEDTTGWKTLDSGNVAYLEGGTGSFYSLSGDSLSVSFNDAVVGENKVELSGVEGTVEFEGTTVKLTSSNFADNVSVVSNDGGYAFDLSEGDYGSKIFNGSSKADSIVNAGTNISIDGAAGDDVITNNAVSDVSISTATGNDTIKVGADVESFNVVAFEQGDELQFASDVESVSYDNGDLLVTIGSGVVTVKGMTAPTNVGEDWLNVKDGTATYGEMAGNKYGFNGKTVTYASETDNVKFTIGGLNKNASSTLLDKVVSIDGTTITFNTTDLFDTSKAVSVSSGYTLAINDSIKPAAAGLSWTQDETDASKYIYVEAGNTDGYKVVDNQIVYDADTRKTFTLEGVANTANVTVKDGKVTVGKSNLASGATAVKLTGDGYTLDLTGVTVGKPSATTTAKFGAVKDGKAAYTQTATTAEYWTKGSDNKSYTFTAADTKTTDLFTLEGVATVSDSMVSGSKVTVGKSNLASGATAVKLTGNGYTLDLTGVTVGKPSATTTAKFSSVKDGKAAYTQTATTAEYWTKGSDNKSYTFTAADTKTTDLFTLEGVATVSDSMVSGSKVTVDKSNLASGATAVKLTGNGYTLDLTGVTVGKPSATTTAKFSSVKDGKAAYTQTATTAEYWTKGSDNKSYTFTAADTKTTDLFTLEGVATVSDSMVSGSKVTVDKSNLASGATAVKLTGNGYTLDLTGVTVGKPSATTTAKFGAVSNGKAAYTQTATTAEYWTKASDNKSYTFTAADTKTTDLFTLEGVATVSDSMVSGSKVTVGKSNLASGATAVKLTGNGYTLDLTGVTVGKPSATTTAKFGAVKDGKAAYTQTATTAEYWTKGSDNKSYTFTAADTKTTDLFTLEGVATVSDSMVSGSKVTVGKSNLANGATAVKLTGNGYTLDLTGVTVGKPSATTTAKFGAVSNGKAAYTQTATTAEYWTKGSDNKSYTFTAADTKTTDLFTLEGVATVSDSMVSGSKVTVDKSNLASGATAVKLTGNGYTLDLTGVTVGKPSATTTAKFGAVKDGKAAYTQTATTAEYWTKGSDNKSYTFTAADTKTTDLFTLEGVATVSDSMVKDGKVTVAKSNLASGATAVKLTGNGYTLDLTGVTVGKPSATTTAKFGAVSNGKVAYTQTATTAEYWTKGSDNKSYTFTAKSTKTSDLFTLSGIANTTNVTVSGKTVTVAKGALNGSDVALTGSGYTLKIASDVPTATTKTAGAFTKVASGTATYKTDAYSEYYTLKDNKLAYTAASGGKTISIKNLNSKTTLDKVKSGITVAAQKDGSYKITFKDAAVLTTKDPTVSASGVTYTVAVAKSLNPSALELDWKVSGTDASYRSDTSAGYTVKDNKVVYSGKVEGTPQIELGGLTKNASLSAPDKKNVLTLDTKVLGSNASLKSNDGGYTVKLTGKMSKKTFTGTAKADTLNIAASNAVVDGGAGNDTFTVSGSKVTLTGGKGNDKISLQKAATIIYGTGDGKDTVNFVKGMQISLSGSTEIKTLGKSGDDLVLGFGKNSSITVTGAKSTDTLKVAGKSTITLEAGKFDLAKSLTFSKKADSVKVAKDFTGALSVDDNIYLGNSKLSSVATINASAVTGKATISGNAKANTILGGKGNDKLLGLSSNDSLFGGNGNDTLIGGDGADKLNGGKGNDILTGGKGNDVFIVGTGNDTITDYAAGDTVKVSGTLSDVTVSGKNVVLKVGKQTVTVKNAKSTDITIGDGRIVSGGNIYDSKKVFVTLGSGSSNKVDFSKLKVTNVDASAMSKAVTLTGDKNDNSIVGGAGNDILKGGKGKDTLWGGAGNDSLYGGAGADTFIYKPGEGKDTIFDYDSSDSLTILKSNGKTGGKFTKSAYSGGDLTLTIDGGGSVVFNGVSKGDKFNINSKSYTFNGKTLK